MERSEAIEIVREYYPSSGKDLNEALETLIPELKESEDERIINEIIGFVGQSIHRGGGTPIPEDKETRWIAWLEKQVEQNLANSEKTCKDELKFKVGDWVILTAGELSTTLQIVNVDTNKKLYWFDDNSYLPIVDDDCLHLWTIQDAKDGDVLANNGNIILFKEISNSARKDYKYIKSHCLALIHSLDFYTGGSYNLDDGFYPATKEQRDLLFKKMREAGYEWDAEKKELRKIAQKPTDKTKIYDSMDDLIADALIEEIEGSELDDRGKYNRIHWIESHRHNPAWSEEDEDMVDNIIKAIHHLLKENDSWDFLEGCLDWLKALKERVQPQNK